MRSRLQLLDRKPQIKAKYSSLFTFRPGTPVFIGISRGEEFFSSLHPLFTTLFWRICKPLRELAQDTPEGEEW